jgi:hypothetical protein
MVTMVHFVANIYLSGSKQRVLQKGRKKRWNPRGRRADALTELTELRNLRRTSRRWESLEVASGYD